MPTCSSSRRCTTRRTSCKWEPRARASRRTAPGGARQASALPKELAERHVTGQELCEAIRRYALEQYGYMAKTVLNSWGLHSTSDFGEIVFNLIRVGQMRKTPSDTRVDFDNVYDFDTALKQDFKITPPGRTPRDGHSRSSGWMPLLACPAVRHHGCVQANRATRRARLFNP